MKEPEKVEVLPADNLQAGLRFDEHRELFAYWERIKGDNLMPSRADFDPVDIPRLLPVIGLVDIIAPGPKFRYRVVGTTMSARFSTPQDGRFVEEAKAPDYGAYLIRVYSLLNRLRAPVYITERTGYSLGYEKTDTRLMLPMGRDHKTPDMILCSTMTDYSDMPDLDDALIDPRHASVMKVLSLKTG